MKTLFIRGLMIALLVFMAACGAAADTDDSSASENNSSESEGNNEASEPISLTWTSGSEGGVWYAGAAGISSLIQEVDPNMTLDVIPGGSVQNISFIEKGDAQIAWMTPFHGNAAIAGEPPFESVAENVVALANGFGAAPFHFVVPADSDIETVEDIFNGDKTYKIGSTTPNTAEDFIVQLIIQYYGSTYDEMRDAGHTFFHGSYTEQADELKNGNVDVTIGSFMLPAAVTQDTSTTRDVRLIPITDDGLIEYLTELGVPEISIPAGTYSEVVNGDEEIRSVSLDNMLVVGRDVPEDAVYQFTKNLHEVQDRLKDVHAGIGSFTIDKGPQDLGNLEIHPGAEKYYKEVGALD